MSVQWIFDFEDKSNRDAVWVEQKCCMTKGVRASAKLLPNSTLKALRDTRIFLDILPSFFPQLTNPPRG